jgi:hypothetical protein
MTDTLIKQNTIESQQDNTSLNSTRFLQCDIRQFK